jgi:leader peptidase (prepilin peptidase)/N-methyltransferase
MGASPIFDAHTWAQVPFAFWAIVFFAFGAVVGSFLNVCIHRMPLEESIVSPPSHCPHCQYRIPWYLNIPLVTWLWLRARCANCRAPISARYFLVELLTALLFLESWLAFGRHSPWLALVYCMFLGGLIVATFIDFEHFIIPDEITLGGIVAGFLCSLLLPALHGAAGASAGVKASLLGIVSGGGIVYAILRLGKLFFGRQKVQLPAGFKVVFGEDFIVLPGQQLRYEDVLYRESDTIEVEAAHAELADRCYQNVPVRLSRSRLCIGDEEMDPGGVPYLEVTADRVVLPREAMGLGDVKFMAAIGAFLGWQAVLFSLFLSSIIGAVAGLVLIVFGQKSLQSRIPYGPYIALAAVVWLLGGQQWWISLWTWR